jgi:uncharacterized protein DUF5916
MRLAVVLALSTLVSPADRAAAQSALSGEPIAISRSSGRITIDGDLGDEGWRNATKVDKWYEINPGDNTEPKVKNLGYLTYDDRFLYAGFEFEDPDPSAIKAPFADRDNIGNGYNDYGGIFVDSRNSGRTATLFVVTPRNIQYDSVFDDASNEDSAPDFFWDSATRINAHGWTLEMRIPFSSLRYRNANPQTWGILLYRNYPRDRHFQFFSAKLPRGSNCLVCRSNPLTGLEQLPGGGHLVAAPYVSASEQAQPREDAGSPLVSEPVKPHIGLDVKYTPNADNAIDFAVNPDFSQIESDTAQISANERFALFFPEKRPFFLEGSDLFQTPIQAVYTRTITNPDWGGRITGKTAGLRYTVLLAQDAGGGSVVIPGPNSSDLATQEFGSTDLIVRLKKEIGLSFVGMLVTDREARGSTDAVNSGKENGNNRVIGPDFQWRPNGSDAVTGQWLYSSSRTPNRPDLADEWTGQHLSGQAAHIRWEHNSKHADWFGFYQDFGDGFRADSGFVPQVGFREGLGGGGWTVRPKGFISRQRTFLNVDYQYDRSGGLISRNVTPGLGMDIPRDGFLQFRYQDEQVRAGDEVFPRRRFGYVVQFSPTPWLSQVGLDGLTGEDIDFDNVRPGHGSTINLNARFNPTQHLELALLENLRWLNVDTATARDQRLFTARVSRVRSTYTFTSRLFLRVIAQYVSTDRDPSLYTTETTARSGEFTSSILLSYKLNWQSVIFVGYGGARELTDQNQLEPSDRQFFVKLSYAFQR